MNSTSTTTAATTHPLVAATTPASYIPLIFSIGFAICLSIAVAILTALALG
jgi:hypothetical protein